MGLIIPCVSYTSSLSKLGSHAISILIPVTDKKRLAAQGCEVLLGTTTQIDTDLDTNPKQGCERTVRQL